MPGNSPRHATRGGGFWKLGRRAAAGAFAFGALAGLGCNARVAEERKVWTLFGIEEALAEGGTVAMGPTLPNGIPAADFLTTAAGMFVPRVQRAFAEGNPAAYVTTEIWVDYYDAVWLEPLYLQLLSIDTPLPDAPLVIDVGPESAFYSPFWQVNAAVVGSEVHSTKDLLDNASQIVPVGMKTCPLHPASVSGSGLALPAPWDTWGIQLPNIVSHPTVYDDEGNTEMVGALDFGPNLFELEVTRYGAIVEPMPMYLFVDADGTPLTSEPRVLSAGEVAHDAAGAPRPRFGAYWHVYKAMLPMGAGAFHGSQHAAARDAAARAGGDPLDYEGRVALNAATCFADPAANDFPGGCIWLDSADKLKLLLGEGNLVATELTQTGPIVLWDKLAVPVNN